MLDRLPPHTRTLLALIAGQICLHACMAGVRMASPLLALRQGYSELAVGVLLGLFAAAPIALALAAGRLADRHGYHRPMRIAVGLTAGGGLLAVASTLLEQGQFAALCVAATLTGAGANVGLIAIQRSAGRGARDSTDLKRVFSWLGLAPAPVSVAAAQRARNWPWPRAVAATASSPPAAVRPTAIRIGRW